MKNDARQLFFLKRHYPLFIRFLLIGALLLPQLSALAQQKTVTGTVIGDDKLPIPGASIVVKGSTIGTVTDVNGKFTLVLPATAQTLVFSFVGMKTQEVAIAGRTVVDVDSTQTADIDVNVSTRCV